MSEACISSDKACYLSGAAGLFQARVVPFWGSGARSGTELSPGIKLFHDAERAVLSWTQRPNSADAFGLALTAYRFDGGFHSLVADIAPEAIPGMLAEPELWLDFTAEATRPIKTFLRLNLYRDGAQETLYDAMIIRQGRYRGRFRPSDLTANMRQGTSAWVDLIFSDPAMSEIELAGLRLSGATTARAA